MQRMLVALVVVLLVTVAIGGIKLWDLSGEVQTLSVRRVAEVGGGRTAPAAAGADPARVQALERQVAQFGSEIRSLRGQLRAARLDAIKRGAEAETGGEGTPVDGSGGETYAAPERERDPRGRFLITEADEDYFIALQDRVQRRRRIDGMTRNVMRRVDRLAASGEIQALPDENREVVERIIRKYVVAGDDLVTAYIRSPSEQIRNLTADQRRDELANQRTELIAAAQQDLVSLLGEADATKVAEQSLQSPWGTRRRSGDRFNRGGDR